MRSHPTSPVSVFAVALLLLVSSLPSTSSSGPGPMDSSQDYQAGYWNTTFTDPAANDLDLTVFYPARTAGENTTKDVTGAPYPLLMFVHQPGLSPAFSFWRSYGEHLSERGFLVGILDTRPYRGDVATDYDDMVAATRDAVDLVVAEDDIPGSQLYGLVNASAVAVAGHGQGAYVALHAAIGDGGDSIHAVASIDLGHPPTAGQPGWSAVGRLEMPLLLLEASTGDATYSHDAFEAKALGYVALLNIEDANFTQFMDNTSVDWPDATAALNHSDQLRLAKGYLMAFLDFHLKGDAMASTRLYGSQAAADLDDGTLAEWRYGVLDQGVSVTRPAQDAALPPGRTEVCATVANVGPFPMPGRNVTLEVALVLPGPVYQNMHGPENRSVAALPAGGSAEVAWTALLTIYGDYVAFVSMDDPDHNRTNDMVQLPFTIAPLLPPTIGHTPPEALELGEEHNLTTTLGAPSGIVDAFVNYSDEEGFRREIALTEDPVSGDFYAHLPAPRSTGQVNYKIHARAGNGATNITNPYYIPVLDTTPPTIEHTPQWTSLPVGADVVFNATVTDAGGIDEVRLLYDEPASGFHNVTCGREGDRWFYPVVVGSMAGTLTYSWYAVDNWGNGVTTANFDITVEDGGPPEIEHTPPGPQELGDELVLEARVNGGSPPVTSWVLYTLPGGSTVTNATPEAVGNLHRLTIVDISAVGTLTYSWWVRDLNGYTVTTGDSEVEVTDTTPPAISDIVTGDGEVGAVPWVQATIADAGGVASAVLSFVDVLGASGSVTMEEVLPDLYEGRLPPQPMGGAVSYSITAEDGSGNSGSSGQRTLVIRDVDPPEISHVPPDDLVEGMEVTFEAEVTDNVGVAEVWLYLRLTSTASFRRLAMEEVQPDVYAYTLPQGELRQPNVMYYFEAEDLPPSGNVITDPLGAPSTTYLLNVTERQMRLFGTVRASGGDPLEGASVSIVGEVDSVVTDEEGAYEFTGLVAGPYIIDVRSEGFEPFSTTVILSAEQGDRRLDVSMVPRRQAGGEDEGIPWTLLASVAIFAVIALLVMLTVRSGGRKG